MGAFTGGRTLQWAHMGATMGAIRMGAIMGAIRMGAIMGAIVDDIHVRIDTYTRV